jgi:hypothetical protein
MVDGASLTIPKLQVVKPVVASKHSGEYSKLHFGLDHVKARFDQRLSGCSERLKKSESILFDL